MKTTASIQISNEEAIVLQQISESGEEDVTGLSRSLRMNHHHVIRMLERLKRKGLVSIKAAYGNWWIHTSAKGTQLIRYMWPEVVMSERGKV